MGGWVAWGRRGCGGVVYFSLFRLVSHPFFAEKGVLTCFNAFRFVLLMYLLVFNQLVEVSSAGCERSSSVVSPSLPHIGVKLPQGLLKTTICQLKANSIIKLLTFES